MFRELYSKLLGIKVVLNLKLFSCNDVALTKALFWCEDGCPTNGHSQIWKYIMAFLLLISSDFVCRVSWNIYLCSSQRLKLKTLFCCKFGYLT